MISSFLLLSIFVVNCTKFYVFWKKKKSFVLSRFFFGLIKNSLRIFLYIMTFFRFIYLIIGFKSYYVLYINHSFLTSFVYRCLVDVSSIIWIIHTFILLSLKYIIKFFILFLKNLTYQLFWLLIIFLIK